MHALLAEDAVQHTNDGLRLASRDGVEVPLEGVRVRQGRVCGQDVADRRQLGRELRVEARLNQRLEAPRRRAGCHL
eukprot:5923107-Alexandrium_andersonii.AAC.1